MATTDILTRVARHGVEIDGLKARVDRHDADLKGIKDEQGELRSYVAERFDRLQWFAISSLVGIVMMLLGVIIDLLVRMH